MSIRVSFTGPHNVGKTTLAKELARQLKWPYVMEYARELLQHDQHRVGDGSLFQSRAMRLRLTDMSILNSIGSDWVADRVFTDYMAYNWHRMQQDEGAKKLIEQDKEQVLATFTKEVDLIFILEPVAKDESKVHDEKVSNDKSAAEIEALMMDFFLPLHEKVGTIIHRIKGTDFDSRVRQALDTISQLREDHLKAQLSSQR